MSREDAARLSREDPALRLKRGREDQFMKHPVQEPAAALKGEVKLKFRPVDRIAIFQAIAPRANDFLVESGRNINNIVYRKQKRNFNLLDCVRWASVRMAQGERQFRIKSLRCDGYNVNLRVYLYCI